MHALPLCFLYFVHAFLLCVCLRLFCFTLLRLPCIVFVFIVVVVVIDISLSSIFRGFVSYECETKEC